MHAMPCHAMPCHAMPCHVMSCHVMPCHVMSCQVRSGQVRSCHVMSCHVMHSFIHSFLACHFRSCHSMSCHFISIISFHFISFQLTSFQLTNSSYKQAGSYSHRLFLKLPPRRVPGTTCCAPLGTLESTDGQDPPCKKSKTSVIFRSRKLLSDFADLPGFSTNYPWRRRYAIRGQ